MVARKRSSRVYKGTKSPKEIEARQAAFLKAYGEVGTVRKACLLTEVGRSTVGNWQSMDILNFKAKIATAREMFRELIQDTMWERVKEQKPSDNPVLILALINAHWPEKYKRDAAGASAEVKEMMVEWKRWARDAKRRDTGVSAPVVTEEDQARRNAIDQVEKLLSRTKSSDDDNRS
jgi:hypothetical protein